MFKSSSHFLRFQNQHRALATLVSPRGWRQLYIRHRFSAASCNANHHALAGQAAVDEHYMRLAMEQAHEVGGARQLHQTYARVLVLLLSTQAFVVSLSSYVQAADAGEVPVGAVLVSGGGAVLAAARNRCELDADPTAHAEMLCIREAAARQHGWRLLDSTLYVTLEPCPMCAGAALQARVGSVVYGARNSLLGADGSWIAMLPRGAEAAADGELSSGGGGGDGNAAAEPQRPHPFHAGMRVRRGVLENESAALMRAFFKKRRQEGAQRDASQPPAEAELP
jgi:tRNA(adenine34) deaminase